MTVDLPNGLSLDEAIAINAECQRYDGIEAVESDGTVRSTARSAEVLKDVLGYDCEAVSLATCEDEARELADRFAAYRRGLELEDRPRAA